MRVPCWAFPGLFYRDRHVAFYCHKMLTESATVVVCVLPPPVPVIVIVWVPTLAPALTAIFIVDAPEPGAAMLTGVKLALTPDGRPDADRVMAELKLPETAVVIVEVPEPSQATASELGEAVMEK